VKDVKTLIREAKLPEDTVPICLRADLQAEFERLERDLERAERTTADSLAGNGARQVAEQIEALRQQMTDATVAFRLRAMPRPAWREFTAGHPPRKDGDDIDDRDQLLGVNVDTFFEALVRASVVEPELDGEDWDLLLGDKLTDRQFDHLAQAAWALNRRDVDVPFSLAASRILNSEPE
jgi:hypothetical protein